MNNSGIISDKRTELNETLLTQYEKGKKTLVTQGGGQRGIFTAGVLDAFLLRHFNPFDEYIGTSAGALSLFTYICRRYGMSRDFILDYTTKPQFFNLFHYLTGKQKLNLRWALGEMMQPPHKLDPIKGRQYLGNKVALAAATNSKNFHDCYFPMFADNYIDVLLASCAIPGLSPTAVKIDGNSFLDGGVSASIPVQEAWRRNARFIVVIRTEPIEPYGETMPLNAEQYIQFKNSFGTLQERFTHGLDRFKENWQQFVAQKLEKVKNKESDMMPILDGDRWRFGAEDIYRLGHFFGGRFEKGLANIAMVHLQTTALTEEFLASPPDDCYIVQIMPDKPLKARVLMSKKEDLEHDYQAGLTAGYNFMKLMEKLNALK